MVNSNIALLVAEPGPVRDGLHAILSAIPNLKMLDFDEKVSTLVAITKHHPNLVIMNPYTFNEQVYNTLRQVRLHSPRTRCVIFTKDMQQQRQFEAAGADTVLLSGMPADRLAKTLEGFVSEQIALPL